MEELRSTDVLDREIIAEAKRKAERILSRAEETCSGLLGTVDARVEEETAKAKHKAQVDLDLFTKNISASFPLDRERYLVSYVYGSVIDAINSYFEKAGEEKLLSVLKKLLERSKGALGNGALNVKSIGIEKSVAEELLSQTIKNPIETVVEVGDSYIADDMVEGFKIRKGLEISTLDKKVTCRLTLDQKIKEILDNNIEELAQALFGGRIPE